MLKLLLLYFVALSFVNGHNNKRSNDADLQSELMPQELNPFFVPAESQQIPAMPLPLRKRRNSEIIAVPDSSTMQQVKTYSRIVTCVVLALSALVELVTYLLEVYS